MVVLLGSKINRGRALRAIDVHGGWERWRAVRGVSFITWIVSDGRPVNQR